MELREWAIQILSGDSLEDKLFAPLELTDHHPGAPLLFNEPVRPVGMQFKRHSRKEKLPSIHDLKDPDKRATCLHRFAGHELLAVEIMAQALLSFPNAPKHFRKGVANTLREEQEHVRLYIERMKAFGLTFGTLPLYRHFWSYVPHLISPLRYVSVMSLTFEMANLDFAPLYGNSFACVGDEASAMLMAKILRDEISHVGFGLNWLKKFKDPLLSEWETWLENLPPQMLPKRATGPLFSSENRLKAGVPSGWISHLKDSLQNHN